MRLVCDVYLWVCDVINWHGFLRKSMALNASLNPLYMHLAVEVPVRLVVKGALGAHLSPETPPHRDARAILFSHTCLPMLSPVSSREPRPMTTFPCHLSQCSHFPTRPVHCILRALGRSGLDPVPTRFSNKD